MATRKAVCWIFLGLAVGGTVRGQEPAQPNQVLPSQTSSLTENDVQRILGSFLKTAESEKEQAGVIVPQTPDLHNAEGGSRRWFSSPSEDFFMHAGAWVQFDSVWSFTRR